MVIKNFTKYLVNLIQMIAGILFSLLFVLNVIKIVLRYFWGISWIWLPDFSRFLFIWMVFLGTSALFYYKDHLLMDYFVKKMDSQLLKKVNLFIDFSLIVFFLVLIIRGYEVSIIRMRIPFDMVDIPTGYAYASIPFCGILMLIFTVERIIDEIRPEGKKNNGNYYKD